MSSEHEAEQAQVAALANFTYKGGAVRLVEPITDTYEHAAEWGHLEKDEYTVPFGPWSEPGAVSAGPWVWRYGVASAATGSSYRVLATRIHADVAAREGGPVVVTVLSPWSTAYPLSDQGYLDHSYVAEKFFGSRTVHGGDLAVLTRLIGLLLGRETSADLAIPPDQRDPTSCPRCGEVCTYDGWGLVHASGLGIGSCTIIPPDKDAP